MSYNGIGLTTARGSGTNGYIQKNTTRITQSSYKRRQENKKTSKVIDLVVKDQSLIQREKKRDVELKVSELRDELEDDDLDDEEIDKRCEELRQELLNPPKKQTYIQRTKKNEPEEVELDY